MTIRPQTTGVHLVRLCSADLARAHAFYGGTLGLPIVFETWDAFVALAGNTVLVIRGPDVRTHRARRRPRTGLERVALVCLSETELERVAEALDAAHVPSTGLRFDPVLQQRYVAFTDPDGIAWEFHLASIPPADAN